MAARVPVATMPLRRRAGEPLATVNRVLATLKTQLRLSDRNELWEVWYELAKLHPQSVSYEYKLADVRRVRRRILAMRERTNKLGSGVVYALSAPTRRSAISALKTDLSLPDAPLIGLELSAYDSIDPTFRGSPGQFSGNFQGGQPGLAAVFFGRQAKQFDDPRLHGRQFRDCQGVEQLFQVRTTRLAVAPCDRRRRPTTAFAFLGRVNIGPVKRDRGRIVVEFVQAELELDADLARHGKYQLRNHSQEGCRQTAPQTVVAQELRAVTIIDGLAIKIIGGNSAR